MFYSAIAYNSQEAAKQNTELLCSLPRTVFRYHGQWGEAGNGAADQ